MHWIRKHGEGNIEIVLLNTYKSEEDLKQAEIDTIRNYRTLGFSLLNVSDGGDLGNNLKGRILPAKQKKAIKEGVIKHFSENKQKSVYEYWISHYGKEEADKMKQEWFKRRSASFSGEGNPMYGRRGESAPCFGRVGEKHPMFGKHHSNEAKKKIGDAFRGKKLSIEVKVNMSKAQHKRAHSDKGLEKPSCVWCNGSTVEQEITRRRSLEDDINLEGTVPANR